ncbi:MAG: hypothetical protein JW891_15045 [Candidatus Lokiarchaeota archaeon]|nr:hypothetical protein [Candidatus Lokiarchaeota archaeon]
MTNILINIINGFSALVLFITALFLFLRDLYRYRFYNITLYIYGMVIYIVTAFSFIGVVLSFISVIALGYTAPWIVGVAGYFSFSGLPFVAFVINKGAWDGKPEKMKIIMLISAILSIIYYIVLFSTYSDAIRHNSLELPYSVYDDWVNIRSLFYIVSLVLMTVPGFSAIMGIYHMIKRSSGTIKKRTKLILISSFLIGIGFTTDATVPDYLIFSSLFLTRFIEVLGLILLSQGYKPTAEH